MNNMKAILGLILFLCLACSNNENKKELMNTNTLQLRICSEWSLCEVVGETSSTSYNACSIVSFFNNGKGEFIKPSKEECHFNWIMKNKKLVISLKEDYDKLEFFSDELEFYCEVKEKGNITVLELTPSVNNTYKYILYKVEKTKATH